MKKVKTLVCFLLILCLISALTTAALADTKKYKVTVSGGLYGTVNGKSQDSKEYAYNDPNDPFDPHDFVVKIDPAKDPEGKYYFKGFRVSGQETMFGTQVITQDTMLVACFGVMGEMVNYTVHYRSTTGGVLHEDDVLSGKIGDKPIVPARHINGYFPSKVLYNGAKYPGAYNCTFTLTGPCEVTFVYKKIPTPTAAVVTPTPTPDEQAPEETPPPEQPGEPEPTDPVAPVPDEGTTPQEIVDLDDPKTPQAPPAENEGTIGSEATRLKKSTWTAIGIGLVGLLAILGLAAYLARRRKKSKE